MSNRTIAIYLNRDPVNNKIVESDKIQIKTCGKHGTFKVIYNYEIGDKNLVDNSEFLYDNEDDLISYLDTCFDMLDKDRIPFYSIDLMIPGFPSVTYKTSDLSQKDVKSLVMDAIEKGINIMKQVCK